MKEKHFVNMCFGHHAVNIKVSRHHLYFKSSTNKHSFPVTFIYSAWEWEDKFTSHMFLSALCQIPKNNWLFIYSFLNMLAKKSFLYSKKFFPMYHLEDMKNRTTSCIQDYYFRSFSGSWLQKVSRRNTQEVQEILTLKNAMNKEIGVGICKPGSRSLSFWNLTRADH